MGSNIITAIINIINTSKKTIPNIKKSSNRMNSMGSSLEEYIKNIFSGAFEVKDEQKRNEIYSNAFSYLGNQNNPPDIILKNGDAIEVKKLESIKGGIALNSSFPKAKLYSDDKMLTKACLECEEWNEKDIIYAVGTVKSNKLLHLSLVYGVDYAASRDVYSRIKEAIHSGVESIKGIDFSPTKELGRVNRVDPLGITYLRIRGMWHIQNPLDVFDYIYKRNESKSFNLFALINTEKYETFIERKQLEEIAKYQKQLIISDVKIKNPNNPAKLKEAKLIQYYE